MKSDNAHLKLSVEHIVKIKSMSITYLACASVNQTHAETWWSRDTNLKFTRTQGRRARLCEVWLVHTCLRDLTFTHNERFVSLFYQVSARGWLPVWVCLCFATIRHTCQIWVANLRNTRHSDCFRNPWKMWWCIKCPDWTLNIDICAGLFRLRQRLSEDRCSIHVTFAKIIIYLCRSCYENVQPILGSHIKWYLRWKWKYRKQFVLHHLLP